MIHGSPDGNKRPKSVLEASRQPGAAARSYEQSKRNYLHTAADCLQQGFSFIPIVGEPSGGWGPSAQCLFKGMARTIAAFTGRDSATELKEHRQLIGVFLRRANARAIFSRDLGPTVQALGSAATALADMEV